MSPDTSCIYSYSLVSASRTLLRTCIRLSCGMSGVNAALCRSCGCGDIEMYRLCLCVCGFYIGSLVSIQTQSLALRVLREIFTQQTQAPANRNARSKQRQPWLAACQRKRLRFLRFSFTQRTQRKRLRLNGNRAWYNDTTMLDTLSS